MNGAILVNKHAGVSSFGIIELLKEAAMKKLDCKHRQLPGELQKMGHGGTLDPFATGLLVVCIGRGVKLSRYFLGSDKSYEATLRFGETTVSGDLTGEISERSDHLPSSLAELQAAADRFSSEPYLQTPPMFSAKKKDGKPLYELAREGIEVEREPKLCRLTDFVFQNYDRPRARFSVTCSSGTYIRTLAQDFARTLGTFGMLDTLHRTKSGSFDIANSMGVEQITDAILSDVSWDALPCFIPFDRLLAGYSYADATHEEATALLQGRQNVLFSILKRVKEPAVALASSQTEDAVVIYCSGHLLAVARKEADAWGLERVFPPLS